MSAEDLGKRLLGEVEEVGLDEVSRSIGAHTMKIIADQVIDLEQSPADRCFFQLILWIALT